ncbi:MAG: hypothetical protein Q8N15_04310 [Bacillota bacterium]|nr:hypothetical protein [Bacillota bacterium]
MAITLVQLEPRTLACVGDRDETLAFQKLETFLSEAGITPEHRYQNEMVMKKNGVRLALYIKYACVPSGMAKTKEIKVIDLPGGPAMSYQVSEAGYVALMDGDGRGALEEFMKENNLWWDLRQMIALAEPKDENGAVVYDILFPVKRK